MNNEVLDMIDSSIHVSDGTNSAYVMNPITNENLCVFCGEALKPMNENGSWSTRCCCSESLENRLLFNDLRVSSQQLKDKERELTLQTKMRALNTWKWVYKQCIPLRDADTKRIDEEILNIRPDDVWNNHGQVLQRENTEEEVGTREEALLRLSSAFQDTQRDIEVRQGG